MPIRMTDDPNSGQDENPGGGGGGRGPNLGGLLQFLPLILGFVIKKPKLLILLIIGGGIYFYFKGCGGFSPLANKEQNSAFKTGGILEPEEYAKADIFNFLDETNNLPEMVSLEKFAPRRLNQGAQGSCVAWSNAYSIRTILESRRTGKDPNTVAFSPAFMYNQIKLGNDCQGSYITRAVDNMMSRGAAPFSTMPYNEGSCSPQPGSDVLELAQQFKIKGATRIAENPNGAMTVADVKQMKYTLAAGAPVAIGMMVGGSFMQEMMGQKLWKPNSNDYDMNGFGGHAMTVIGYDNNLAGGSFQIMNSWGPEWGQNGLAWVSFKDFIHFNKEAYAYAPMGAVNEPVPTKFDVEFGLVASETGKAIGLQSTGTGTFKTTTKVAPGTRFKIRIKNNIECYAYVCGQETDNTSYVLYPKTAKHSAYCGVTGSRVFPHSQSLTPDNVGTKDAFSVIISRQALDYVQINTAVSALKGSNYYTSFNTVLRDKLLTNITYKTGNTVTFTADSKDNKLALFVIEVEK